MDFYRKVTPSGTYRFHAEAYAYGGTGHVRAFTKTGSATNWTNLKSLTVDAGQTQVVDWTLECQGELIVRIVPPYPDDSDGMRIMLAEPQLELAGTFDISMPFFHGGLMPLN